ncbi:Vacuolar protein sorting-associated protein 33A [Gryllus bimaculatus]|nr:Vacuolar protein sorting-associated protein 33A [Gryllus bimaculatus]
MAKKNSLKAKSKAKARVSSGGGGGGGGAALGGAGGAPDAPKVVLVFFLGGCTYAEVAALRFLSQQEDLAAAQVHLCAVPVAANVEFLVATTKMINGDSFLRSLMEPAATPAPAPPRFG